MKFAITKELDTKSYDKSSIIQKISDDLEKYLLNKNYGSQIETFYIGFIAVKSKLGVNNDWYNERKPKYVDYKQTKNRLTGVTMETVKEFSYDIKFDYELYDEFVNCSDEESKKLLARKILESFEYLDKLPKKIKDFDKKKFKTDVEGFFREQNLI